MARVRRSGGGRGFTLIEILIAVAILTVGILGVLALFPVAISIGKEVIQNSTAALVAKSVTDAIRTGMQHRKRTVRVGRGGAVATYFVFDHDGVKDLKALPPGRVDREDPTKDYFILLPDDYGTYTAQGGMKASDIAYNQGKVLVYPETDPRDGTSTVPPNGARVSGGRMIGDPTRADNDRGEPIWDVYRLGEFLPPRDERSLIRIEEEDPIRQYSFAFSIRRSDQDSNATQERGRYRPANELYEVTVMVFRSFQRGTTYADMENAYKSTFLVSK